jgi:hypothetical protein
MRSNRRKCALKFVEGLATSISAHAAAWAAVATGTFLWQFVGHVAADAGFHLVATLVGH